MTKKFLPQEGLKLIACITMLIDHLGYTLFPYITWLRIIGRLAFPIYCFLLAEGAYYTKNPLKYGIRLFVGMLLAELPYDLVFYRQFSWYGQSVMVTLLLGFIMAVLMKKAPLWAKLLIAIPFVLIADQLNTDYAGMGIVVIAIFVITRDMENSLLIQTLALLLVFLQMTTSSIQVFAVAAMIPIALYSGKKVTSSPVLQWGFYLFYPVHLAVLWLIRLF